MAQENYVIRKMTRDDVEVAVQLAKREGWNPGLYDADSFYTQDPNGFLIGILDGEPISCISVVKYGSNYGFLGFYIVKEGYRGNNYGLTIWQAGMNYLAGRMVGLDGVIAQVANYQKSGFQLAHYSKRYQGEATGETLTDARIVDLADLPFEELKSYDEAVFSFPRSDFLHQWIKMPESIALGIKEDNQLAGYAVLRKCYEGYKVGPLFADNAELAETLFKVITSRIPKGTPVFLDIPDDTVNPEATLLAKRYHMQEVFQTARMYRPADPYTEIKLPLHKWYGITSFELG